MNHSHHLFLLHHHAAADKYLSSDRESSRFLAKIQLLRRVARRRFLRTNRIALHFDVIRVSNGCLQTLRNAIRGLAWRRGRSEQDRNQEGRDFHRRHRRQHAKTRWSRRVCLIFRFLRRYYLEGRVASALGIIAVVGAGKDQFVRVIMPDGHATRTFALKKTTAASRCTEYWHYRTTNRA